MVFQNYALYPHLNVGENIAFGLRDAQGAAAVTDERVGWSRRTSSASRRI